MAAVRGRTIGEFGQAFQNVNITASAPVGQPTLLRTWGIPTGPGWYALGPGKWNLGALPLALWYILEWLRGRFGG